MNEHIVPRCQNGSNMDYLLTELSSFQNRKERLENIVRYHGFPTMFYRTNLWQHAHRLYWMVDEVAPRVTSIWPNFNTDRAKLLALIHDDIEMIIGDVQLGEKRTYSEEQQEALNKREQEAVDIIASEFPSMVGNFSYKQTLQDYQDITQTDKEACIVKWIDKFDAFGEALHELFSGNQTFSVGYKKGITEAPVDSYIDILNTIDQTYPLLKQIHSTVHPLFTRPDPPDIQKILANAKLPTNESIQKSTWYEPYNIWKRITIEQGAIEWLTRKRE